MILTNKPMVGVERNSTALEALRAARQFIANGIELGFISMPEPETPDSAHGTLPMIQRAIAVLEGHSTNGLEPRTYADEAGAAEQASLCDIVAQVRMARKAPGTGPLQLLALVPDQVVGRVHHNPDQHDQVQAVLNSCGRALPDNAPLYARPADHLLRYVRVPSRKDPKYHEDWPEIEGGPVFDGVTYCKDLFKALKHYNVLVAETMPDGSVDE